MSKIKKLIIIGNGFDLEHDLKTSYSNFAEFCSTDKNNFPLFYPDNKLYKKVFWSNLETFMFSPSIHERSKCSAFFYLGNGFEKTPEEKRNYLSALSKRFNKWIKTFKKEIDKLEPKELFKDLFKDKKNCHFINFNYTNVLEEVYEIPTEKLIKIHKNNKYNVLGESPIEVDKRFLNFHAIDKFSLLNWTINKYKTQKIISFLDYPYENEDNIDINWKISMVSNEVRENLKSLIKEKVNKETHIYFYGFSFGVSDGYFLMFLINENINIDNIKIHFSDKQGMPEIVKEFIKNIKNIFYKYWHAEKYISGEITEYYQENITSIGEDFKDDMEINKKFKEWIYNSILVWKDKKWITYSNYIQNNKH